MMYEEIILGRDEPQEIWLTGESAKLFLEKLGEPIQDAFGQPIDVNGFYFLSKATGLVPIGDEA